VFWSSRNLSDAFTFPSAQRRDDLVLRFAVAAGTALDHEVAAGGALDQREGLRCHAVSFRLAGRRIYGRYPIRMSVLSCSTRAAMAKALTPEPDIESSVRFLARQRSIAQTGHESEADHEYDADRDLDHQVADEVRVDDEEQSDDNVGSSSSPPSVHEQDHADQADEGSQ
jgi:hypothetical protein